jgi:hypothetical protein
MRQAIITLGAFALVGCAPLVGKLKGEDSAPAEAVVIRGEIFSSMIRADDGMLKWEGWVEKNVDCRLTQELTGPGVEYRQENNSTDSGAIPWDDAWPSGTYTLTRKACDTAFATAKFEMTEVARADGTTELQVVHDDPPPVVMGSNYAFTLVPVNVARSYVVMDFVFVRDHHVVDSDLSSLSISTLTAIDQLGRYLIASAKVDDATGATLYLFRDGAHVGTFTVASRGETPVLLAARQPNAADLKLATAVAKRSVPEKITAEDMERSLDLRVDERLACAVATDATAREGWSRALRLRNEKIAAYGGSYDAAVASEDTRLTRKERADARAQVVSAGHLGDEVQRALEREFSKAKRVAARQKPGCLKALGIR